MLQVNALQGREAPSSVEVEGAGLRGYRFTEKFLGVGEGEKTRTGWYALRRRVSWIKIDQRGSRSVKEGRNNKRYQKKRTMRPMDS